MPGGVPDFGRSVNSILIKGAGYAHQIILAPPDFQTFLRPCDLDSKQTYTFHTEEADGIYNGIRNPIKVDKLS